MSVCDRAAVQHHEVPSCHMIADQDMPFCRNKVFPMPLNVEAQQCLQCCSNAGVVTSKVDYNEVSRASLVVMRSSSFVPEMPESLAVSHRRSTANNVTQRPMRKSDKTEPAGPSPGQVDDGLAHVALLFLRLLGVCCHPGCNVF